MSEPKQLENQNPASQSDPALCVAKGEFTGLLGGLSNPDYHKAPGLSFTGMKQFAVTPADYAAYLRTQKDPSDDQRLGSLVHMRVLEPEVFEKQVVVVDGIWGGKIKAQVEELRALGQFPAKSKEIEQAKLMSDAILRHAQVREILSKGAAEQSCFWKQPVQVLNPVSGEATTEEILCKARPDYLREDGIIADIKWFNDLSERALRSQITRMKYHWQAAWYLHGVGSVTGRKLTQFVHIFIQEKDPYNVRCVYLGDPSLDKAYEQIQELLPQYAQCLKLNYWPGYPERLEHLEISDWAWGDLG